MAKQKFIAAAISRPGALTSAVGGPPGQNLGKVRKLAAGGGRTAKQAEFYLNVLKPGSARSAAVRAAKGGK